MLVFRHIESLKKHLNKEVKVGQKVGFVPTMGSLHSGHLSLLEVAKARADISVVSIYVNPTQFNDKGDFDKYPREISRDLDLLDRNGCDVVWLPQDHQMYPQSREVAKTDYGALTNSIEGHYRPGHFDGMVDIVRKLLKTVNAHLACFGQKDFQQLAIIKHLVKQEKIPTEIVGCPIIREDSGLAMSSRNARLSENERMHALSLSQCLKQAQQSGRATAPELLTSKVKMELERSEGVKLEYFYIINATTFEITKAWVEGQACRMVVAANVGPVRLIDNMEI